MSKIQYVVYFQYLGVKKLCCGNPFAYNKTIDLIRSRASAYNKIKCRPTDGHCLKIEVDNNGYQLFLTPYSVF